MFAVWQMHNVMLLNLFWNEENCSKYFKIPDRIFNEEKIVNDFVVLILSRACGSFYVLMMIIMLIFVVCNV